MGTWTDYGASSRFTASGAIVILKSDFTKMEENFVILDEWIGKSYTRNEDHEHDGTDSKAVAIGNINGLVTQSKLSTALSEVSKTAPGEGYLNFTTTSYLFYPQVKTTQWDNNHEWHIARGSAIGTVYETGIYLKNADLYTVIIYAQGRYVQASPPYKLGDLPWGGFLFLHRKKSDGTILTGACAPDPIWAGPWSPLPKDHPGRIVLRPHPFADFRHKELPSDEEIILVDLRHLEEIIEYDSKPDRLEAITSLRSELLLAGLTKEELDKEEEKFKSLENPKLQKLSKYKILEKRLQAQGSSILQAVNEGKFPELSEVDQELSPKDRKYLPQFEGFTSKVRVLRKR